MSETQLYPHEIDSPEYVLFHGTYGIWIQEKYLITEESERDFGSPMSGDKSIDKDYGNRQRPMYATIVQIAEWVDMGAGVQLQRHTDSITIASFIRKHIDNWLFVASKDRSAPFPPIEDFRKLETLMLLCQNSMKAIHGMEVSVVAEFDKLFGTSSIGRDVGLSNIRLLTEGDKATPILVDGKELRSSK